MARNARHTNTERNTVRVMGHQTSLAPLVGRRHCQHARHLAASASAARECSCLELGARSYSTDRVQVAEVRSEHGGDVFVLNLKAQCRRRAE
jgi:hypothetical protein